jgi:hypothetical protein
MKGFFISKGITPIIKSGDLVIEQNEAGKIDMKVVLSLQYDSCPTWLNLSVEHLKQTKNWSIKRNEAFDGINDEFKSETLQKEFEHSMQAIIAIAIAYDSFYATIKTKINLPEDLTEKWKQNRTSRSNQITETIRSGFKINKDGTKILKQAIKEIFHFRDLAVHPSGNVDKPVIHPELNIGMEWRFATFTYNSAKLIVNEGLKRIREIINIKTDQNIELGKYCSTLLISVNSIIEMYENEIDQLK